MRRILPEGKQITQFVAAVSATGLAWAIGTTLGWSLPMEPLAKAGKLDFSVSKNEFSWIGAVLPLGALVTCLPTGILMDVIGRRLTSILTVIPFMIGWILIICAKRVWLLIVGRLFLGMAAGAASVVVPMYVGEIAQKEIRGALIALFQAQLTLGILFVYVVGAIATPLWINITCSIVPVVFAVAMFFGPETPLFRLKKGKDEAAEITLRYLRGKEYDIKPEMNETREDIAATRQQGSLFEAIRQREFRKAIVVTAAIMVFQQLSGINAIIFYTTDIFRLAGSTLKPKYCAIIVAVVQLIATMVAVGLVDRLGRRFLLLVSAGGIVLSALGLGVYFYEQAKLESSVESIGWFPLAALCLHIIVFAVGFGPVPWILVGELFPSKTKGVGGAAAVFANYLLTFIVAKIYPGLKNAIGIGQTFWLFSLFTILALIFVLFLVPETKKKSLVEIQELLKS